MTDLDRAILELEKRRYRYGGMKVAAIREELQLTDVAYYQRLNRLLTDPEALQAEPQLIRRLQRVRGRSIAQRRARTRIGGALRSE